jgi:hypothetical protein
LLWQRLVFAVLDARRKLSMAEKQRLKERFELSLLTTARWNQADVQLVGARGVAIDSMGLIRHDVIKAGLEIPSGDFTVVISDSRRIPLSNGPLARIVVEGRGTVAIRGIRAVTTSGTIADIRAELPPGEVGR